MPGSCSELACLTNQHSYNNNEETNNFEIRGVSRIRGAPGQHAIREHEQGASSRALVTSRVWRRWLLDAPAVTELFNQAERIGVLRFSQAGSAVRVDWRATSLEEVARAAA